MKRNLLLLVVGLQVLWIVAVSAVQETRLRTGTVIRLETRPVDPRDLLRGDFVILAYPVGTVAPSLFPDGKTPETTVGSKVWVRLGTTNGFHVARGASFAPLRGTAAEPVMAGTVKAVRGDGAVDVAYGLERFYVREGTGNPHGKLTVEASVSAAGDATIREVYVDGVPYAKAMAAERR